MIIIKNVKTLDNQITDYTIPSSSEDVIEADGKLLLLPGVVDPHICFGSMKETRNWDSAISSAVRGGLTAVIETSPQDMPCNNKENLEMKYKIVDKKLADLQIPLSYHLNANADLNQVEGLGFAKELIKGVVIQLDPNKKEMLDDRWDRFFQMAAWEDIPIIINSQNENTKEEYKIADRYASLLEKAIYYVEKQNARLYVLNVANQQEIDLIQAAKKRAVLVYSETTPQHLFQEDSTKADCLWKALNDGAIETLGSGYDVDHQGKERVLFRGGNFSFQDPIFLLPLLLTACQQGKISMEQIVSLVSLNIHDIFNIERNQDVVLIDLEKEETIQKLSEKKPLSMTLKGWPAYTIIQGHIFSSPQSGYHLNRKGEE